MRPDGEGMHQYRHRRRQRRRGSEKLTAITSLRPGDSATITSVGGSRRIAQRLADLGLVPQTAVYMQRCAPFNGPIELIVRGSRLAIGRDIAENIFVEAK